MKKNAYYQDIVRTIRKSRKRFLAIMIITILGVTMFSGLEAACVDLRKSGDKFFDEQTLHDLSIQSTLGLTEADVEALSELEGVGYAEGSYAETVTAVCGEKSLSISLQTLSPTGIDEPYLLEGRMPQTSGEMVVTEKFMEKIGAQIGDAIRIEEKLEPGDEDTDPEEPTFSNTVYTIVGSVINVLSVNNPSGATSFRSTATTDECCFVLQEAANSDIYTSINLLMEGGKELFCYGEEYKTRVIALKEEIEILLKEKREQARYDQVVGDAYAELEEKETEVYGELADAEKELTDGEETLKQELADAEKELNDAEQKLTDGKAELEEGWKEYQDGEQEAASQIASARDEINSGKQQLDDAKQTIAANQQQLSQGSQQLNDGLKQAEDGLAQLDQGLAQIDDGIAQIDSGASQIDSGIAQIDDGIAQIDAGIPQIEDGIAQIDAGYSQINQGRSTLNAAISLAEGTLRVLQGDLNVLEQSYNAGLVTESYYQFRKNTLQSQIAPVEQNLASYRAQLDEVNAQEASMNEQRAALVNQKAELEAQRTELLAQKADLEAQKESLPAQREELVAQKAELEKKRSELTATIADLKKQQAELQSSQNQINQAKAEIQSKEQQLSSGEAELNRQEANSKQQLADAKQELLDGEAELADGEQKLSEGWEEYYQGKADGEAELADGWKEYNDGKAEAEGKFADAREEINEIEMATWYIWNRESLDGYRNIGSDADSIEAIGTVFPIVFFIVAIMISLTTVTRMVEEDRGLIGTYKALGFSNREIRRKYLCYAGSASVLGSIIGTLAAFILLPYIVCLIFRIMYLLPEYIYQFVPLHGILGPFLFLGGILTATLLACKTELVQQPASLMRPKTPRAGSRVLLERIPMIWNRMSFLNKVTVRNLFRYKKRLIMTISGIAGCMALLLFGFAIKDSVDDLMPRQYEQTFHYDLLTAVAQGEDNGLLLNYLDEENGIADYVNLELSTVTVSLEGSSELAAQILVFPDGVDPRDYITLKNLDGEELELRDGDIYITRNAGIVLDFGIGDTVHVQFPDLTEGELVVTDMIQNYLSNYIIMNESTCRILFGSYEANGAMAHLSAGVTDAKEFADAFKAHEKIVTCVATQSLIDEFSKAFILILMVVYVVIIMSAALAFVVLFTLATTNISERERELATIKVLGFFDGEVHLYVNKETYILTLLGILVGIPLGYAFAQTLTIILNLPAIYLATSLHGISYLYATGLTLLFAVIVNLITNRSLNNINPVEALKSVE